MFLAITCSVIMGVSRRFGDLLLGLLSVLLKLAFCDAQGALNVKQSSTLMQIPLTIETVISKFSLDGQITTYAVCPTCHYTYKPTIAAGSSISAYPERCTNRQFPDSEVCNANLLEPNGGGENNTPKPIKTFDYPHFHDFVGGLLCRKDIEEALDRSCDILMESINQGLPPPTYVVDVFQGEFLRTFEGPTPGKLFVDRGTESRLVFAFNVDFFQNERSTVRGASTSCGIIAGACLNLPPDIRYKPENMYLAIIPGPNEPHLTELNHYMRPLIDDLLVAWERGVRYSRTACHPTGRDTRSAMALDVCDLPAARKVSGAAGHGSHFYCTVCHCYHQSTLGRTDVHSSAWNPRDPRTLRSHAEAWRDAPSADAQKKLFQANGLRWSELWRLPYWDPTRMLAVDSMHCLLEGLSHYHFRYVLQLTSLSAHAKDAPAFSYPFKLPGPNDVHGMHANELKQVDNIHTLLMSSMSVNSKDVDFGVELALKLSKKNKKPLVFVAENLDVFPACANRSVTKVQLAEALVTWVCLCFLDVSLVLIFF